ncbi:hypothetical protein BDF21DRAFT_407137 [Thamnidium elegans]|nr:hypothetical protein BDF21DRAFT_407137 [Thamnidium elegans]
MVLFWIFIRMVCLLMICKLSITYFSSDKEDRKTSWSDIFWCVKTSVEFLLCILVNFLYIYTSFKRAYILHSLIILPYF